ncbi:adenylyl-sulfate kinase [Crassaminicella profunda]|uniref:adenylyl-sulfate kinase n=1 Tax=Crassaminicella profunda TaxID=1286698 RepID=UPI001CA7124B|nr:adenylyl-sulfate kinase [Crassaminicella profunda]QZY54327.1 adenylyl-sulfate kinase [Crassaminicella profunda]
MEKAYTMWLTGLSCSGKSTLAEEIVKIFEEKGKKVQLIDGDIIRDSIGNIFGYSKEERMKVIKVYRLLCNLLNNNGVYVIVASIAGYQEMREENRREIGQYYEIYVNCPLEVCIERDVKGMYKKALQGEIKNVMGLDEPYDIPQNPDAIIKTAEESIEKCIGKIHELIEKIEK